jgi:hypothetical protein
VIRIKECKNTLQKRFLIMYEERNVLSGGLEASPEAWESCMWVSEKIC